MNPESGLPAFMQKTRPATAVTRLKSAKSSSNNIRASQKQNKKKRLQSGQLQPNNYADTDNNSKHYNA
jgi:hypothetical protein